MAFPKIQEIYFIGECGSPLKAENFNQRQLYFFRHGIQQLA
jgi:hypothetical protein